MTTDKGAAEKLRGSLSKRLPEHIFSKIHEDIGQASMCWNPNPAGEYDATSASTIAFKLCHFIADELEVLLAEKEREIEKWKEIAESNLSVVNKLRDADMMGRPINVNEILRGF